MFCQFEDSEQFEEYYDLAADPHQLDNLAPLLGDQLASQRDILDQLSSCRGQDCQQFNTQPGLETKKTFG